MNEDCAIIWLIMLLHLLLDHSYPYLSFLSLLHLFLRSPTIPPSLCLILKPLGIMIMHTEPYHLQIFVCKCLFPYAALIKAASG